MRLEYTLPGGVLALAAIALGPIASWSCPADAQALIGRRLTGDWN